MAAIPLLGFGIQSALGLSRGAMTIGSIFAGFGALGAAKKSNKVGVTAKLVASNLSTAMTTIQELLSLGQVVGDTYELFKEWFKTPSGKPDYLTPKSVGIARITQKKGNLRGTNSKDPQVADQVISRLFPKVGNLRGTDSKEPTEVSTPARSAVPDQLDSMQVLGIKRAQPADFPNGTSGNDGGGELQPANPVSQTDTTDLRDSVVLKLREKLGTSLTRTILDFDDLDDIDYQLVGEISKHYYVPLTISYVRA